VRPDIEEQAEGTAEVEEGEEDRECLLLSLFGCKAAVPLAPKRTRPTVHAPISRRSSTREAPS
jgi:hypothetical protein